VWRLNIANVDDDGGQETLILYHTRLCVVRVQQEGYSRDWRRRRREKANRSDRKHTHMPRRRPNITRARFTTFNYNSRPNKLDRVQTGGSSLLYVNTK